MTAAARDSTAAAHGTPTGAPAAANAAVTIVDTTDLCLSLKHYGTLHRDGSTPQRLDALSLAIDEGDRIALQGPSGVGKSVLLRTLAWLNGPLGGKLRFRGTQLMAADVPQYRSRVSYLPQRPWLATGAGESVRDALQQPFAYEVHKHRRFDEAQAATLVARAGKPPEFLDNTAATLSGGEAQVAALIRALLLAPEVLLLDEPTAALDHESVAAIEQLVGEWADADPARAYVWISHDPVQATRIGRTQWHVSA